MPTLKIDPSKLKFWWSACASRDFPQLPLTYTIRTWDYRPIGRVSYDQKPDTKGFQWAWNLYSEYGGRFHVDNDLPSHHEISFENMLKIEEHILLAMLDMEKENEKEAARLLSFKATDLINPST